MKANNSIFLFAIALSYNAILNSCKSESEDIIPFTKIASPECEQITINEGDKTYYEINFIGNNIQSCQIKDQAILTYNYENDRLVSINPEIPMNSIYTEGLFTFDYNAQNMVSKVNRKIMNGESRSLCTLTYDKKNRFKKFITSRKYYHRPYPMLGYYNAGWFLRVQTIIIEYGTDGNILTIETSFITRNLDKPYSKKEGWFYKQEYSGYDSSPNAFRFFANSFYLQFILDFSQTFTIEKDRIPAYFGMSINNPTLEKVYFRNIDDEYKLQKEYTYSIKYSNDLVSRVIKKDSQNKSLVDLTFHYSCK